MEKPVFISDLGKVLVDYDPYIIINQILPYTSWSARDMYDFFASDSFFADYEKGRLSEGEFFARLRDILGIDKLLSDSSLKQIWNSMFFPIREMLSFIRQCAEADNARLFLLSNISATHYEFLMGKYEELSLFEEHILSYKVGHRKPEKEIFEHALALSGDAHDIIFTDDRDDFISSARKAGIDAFVFRGYDDFLRELSKREAFAGLLPKVPDA